jgi:hypothetical protein
MSIRAYAAHLGVSPAAVANWERRGEQARMRTETQQILDTDLAGASDDVRDRFFALTQNTMPLPGVDDSRRTWIASNGRPDLVDTDLSFAHLVPGFEASGKPGQARGRGVSTTRRIGRTTVDDLAGRVHALRLADDVLAGGDLVIPACRELRAAIGLFRDTIHTETLGHVLLIQIGELAQVAGWIASDAGYHELAERAYRIGISAARQTDNASLAANLAGSLAYQHANTGREQDAVILSEAAVEEAGRGAPGKVRALFLDRLAWAYARTGQERPAIRALGEAHEALARDAADSPQWAYWVTNDELDIMDARVLTELHRPSRAIPQLSEVLSRYDASHARELALYLSWLAVANADANEAEAAASTAERMLNLSASLASQRAAQRTQVVMHRLTRFASVPAVRDLLHDHPATRSPQKKFVQDINAPP